MMTEVFEQTPCSGQTEAGQLLSSFWPKKMQEIRSMTDFKTQELPLARIKKIMKQDEEVKMISAEAPVLFAKAAEIFINELSLRAWVHTEDNKRRTLQRNDIAMAITKYDMFDFLIDIVPRDELKPNKRQDTMRHTMMATPQEQVQYYFQLAHQYQQQQPQAVQAQTQQQLQVGTQQPAVIGGITQPQQGTVVVTMASGQQQLIQTQPQDQSEASYPIHYLPPSVQYINRIQQIQLQQQQQQQQQQQPQPQQQQQQQQPPAVQIQGVTTSQPQVVQAQQQQTSQQVQAQPPQQVQVSSQEAQQQTQPTSQNLTPSTGQPQQHAEYASYGGQIYQIQTATPGGAQQVYITAAPDHQQQPPQSTQQSQTGESELSQSAEQQGQ